MHTKPWPLERVLFALAGSVTLASVLLSAFVSPWFLVILTFLGVSQVLFASAGWCPTSWLLERITPLERGCKR